MINVLRCIITMLITNGLCDIILNVILNHFLINLKQDVIKISSLP